MVEMHPETAELRQNFIKTFAVEASEWNSRKHDAPRPENDDDYWWECKAKWSICAEAETLVEKADTSGTPGEYIVRIRKMFSDQAWGSTGNWGSSSQYGATSLVKDRLNRVIADSAKTADNGRVEAV